MVRLLEQAGLAARLVGGGQMTEVLYECWASGLSIQDTITSVLRRADVGVSFEYVRRKFAEFSYEMV